MSAYHFSPLAVPPLATAVVLLALAIAIAAKRFSRLSMTLVGIAVSAAAWQIAMAFLDLATGPRNALIWAKVACACALFVPAAAYQFVTTFLESRAHRRIASVVAWVVAAQLAMLTLTTSLFVAGVLRSYWGFHTTLAVAARIVYPIFWSALFIAAIVELAIAWKTAEKKDQDRIRSFAIALSLAGLAAVDFIAAIGILIFPLGWVALVAALLVAASAIRKYGLPEVHPTLPATEIIGAMRDLLLVSDRDGIIRFANNAACSFLGYNRDDLVGMHLEDVLSPTDKGASAPSESWLRDREYVFRTKMGQPIELTLSHSPVTREGEVTGAVIIGRDLRERKRYEWEARRALTLLESTLDSTADGILVIGHDGRVLLSNNRFADMWGIPPEVMQRGEEHDEDRDRAAGRTTGRSRGVSQQPVRPVRAS
jgi:PAS domain S-box-containing protein